MRRQARKIELEILEKRIVQAILLPTSTPTWSNSDLIPETHWGISRLLISYPTTDASGGSQRAEGIGYDSKYYGETSRDPHDVDYSLDQESPYNDTGQGLAFSLDYNLSTTIKILPEAGEKSGELTRLRINYRAYANTYNASEHGWAPGAHFDNASSTITGRIQTASGQSLTLPIVSEQGTEEWTSPPVELTRELLVPIGTSLTVDLRAASTAVGWWGDGSPQSIVDIDNYFNLNIVNLGPPSLPDLAPTTPAWESDGSLDFGYSITGQDLDSPTTVGLYWASGTTFDTAIGGPIYSKTTQTAVGSYGPFHVAASTLGTPPQGAKYLLAVADPGNAVAESNEDNNVQYVEVTQVDLSPASLSWNVAEGGVDYSYSVDGKLLQDSTAALYWSDDQAFDKSKDIFVAQSLIKAGQTPSGVHIDSSSIVNPPASARFLLLVVDPDGQVSESDETNNVKPLAYEPKVSINAKYDGDSDLAVVGRFFARSGIVNDESFTVTLSDSLAALRPDGLVKVGGVGLRTTPKTGLLGTWDGKTFETEAFDPGTLSGDTPLRAQALRNSQSLNEADSTSIHVVPFPSWLTALDNLSVSFAPTGGGPTGSYTFRGFVANLGSPPDANSLPADLPFVGGKHIGASAGFGLQVVAGLSTDHDPTVSGFVGMKVTFLDATILEKNLDTSTNLGDTTAKVGVTLDLALSPETLEANGDFGLTITLTDKAPLGERDFYSGITYVAFPPAIVEYGIKANVNLDLKAQVKLSFHQGGGLKEFVPDETYFDLGVEAVLKGYANVGWFVPQAIARRLGIKPGDAVQWSNEISGSLAFHSRTTYTDQLAPNTSTFGGVFDVQASSAAQIIVGGRIIAQSPPIKVRLFPDSLPYRWGIYP